MIYQHAPMISLWLLYVVFGGVCAQYLSFVGLATVGAFLTVILGVLYVVGPAWFTIAGGVVAFALFQVGFVSTLIVRSLVLHLIRMRSDGRKARKLMRPPAKARHSTPIDP